MSKINILFINGVADNKKMTIRSIGKEGAPSFAVTGSTNIKKFIQDVMIDSSMILLDTDPKQEVEVNPGIDAIFNQISDADSHKITLAKTEKLHQSLPEELPFFNSPANIMKTTRDNIPQLLQGIDKLHVPKTVRIQPRSPSDIYNVIEKEDFEFPVIFRQAGDHGAISTMKIDNKTEQFYTYALDGRDYYLTQFVDYADNGIYVKYRLVVVDGEVFLNDVMFSKNWLVQNKTQEAKLELEEDISKRFLNEIKPLIQPIISKIHHRLDLDYFGMDCHIDNKMNLLIFEINANMSVFREGNMETGLVKDHVKLSYDALIEMLSSK